MIASLARLWIKGKSNTQPFSFFYENVLGTSFDLRLTAPSSDVAEKAEQAALDELDRLEQIFSRFLPGSEFCRWQDNRGVQIPISSELFAVLSACDTWRAQSGGVFNPATEVLAELWRSAAEAGHVPTPESIAEAVRKISQDPWQLDYLAQTAICRVASLSLHSVAKGYIVDRVCDAVLRTDGAISSVRVNIGGDLCVRGECEEHVGIADPMQDAENAPPFARIRIRNNAVATSGDWRRGFYIGGTLYSHILDARTGYPASIVRSASVFAPTAMEADVLATILSIVAPAEGLAMADSLPNVGCLLIDRDGQGYRNARWREQEDR